MKTTKWTREREGVYRSGDYFILRDRSPHWRSHTKRYGVPDRWDVCTSSSPIRLIRGGFSTLADAKAFVEKERGER